MKKASESPELTTAKTSGIEAFIETASSAIFQILPQPHSEEFEFYSITSRTLAKLSIHLSESDPFTAHRRRQDIRDDSAFDYLVLVPLEGSADIEQEKTCFTVEPGSMAVIPGGLPYQLSFPQKGKRLLLRIPLYVFHERVLGREIRDFGTHVFSGAGLIQLTVDMLKSLVLLAGELSETEQYTVAEVTLNLISTVVRSAAEFNEFQHGSAQVARMSRILSYLEENYADHELTPPLVAEANAVSTRHLHNLFQHSGTTVTRWIWERRLKAAREDILNPTMADKSITEIAYQRGFNDSAHFSRTFKARFDIAPSKLRKKIHKESIS